MNKRVYFFTNRSRNVFGVIQVAKVTDAKVWEEFIKVFIRKFSAHLNQESNTHQVSDREFFFNLFLLRC